MNAYHEMRETRDHYCTGYVGDLINYWFNLLFYFYNYIDNSLKLEYISL